ncbi:MAG: hypothetical protein ACUVYA_00890 [Planctomycetota bacterium]
MIQALAIAIVCALPPQDPELRFEVFGDRAWSRYTGAEHDFPRPEILPVRLRVGNLRDSERKLDLVLRIEGTGVEVTGSASVPARGTLETTLPVVSQGAYWHRRGWVRVLEGGNVLDERDFLGPGMYRRPEATPLVVICDAAQGLAGIEVSLPSVRYVATKAQVFLCEPESIPPHVWQAYGFAPFVVVHGPALSRLSPAQKEALWKYAAWGGSVILIEAALEELLPSAIAQTLRERGRAVVGGTVYPFLLGYVSVAARISDATVLDYFRAKTGVFTAQFPSPESAFSAALWKASGLSYWEERSNLTVRSGDHPPRAGSSSPGVLPIYWKFRGPPITTYLLVLAGFALVAGPLNYLFVRRLKRPLVLLLTGPGLSIAFVALLLAAAILSYGTGLIEAKSTFTLLDPSLGLQATTAKLALFSAFPPRWIHMPRDRLLLPLYWSTEPAARWSEDQAYRGLLLPRVASLFLAAEIGSTRSVLLVSKKEGALEATNGLGARIERLVVRKDGAFYACGPVEAGAAARLSPRTEPWPPPAEDSGKRTKQGSSVDALLRDIFQAAPEETWYESPASLYAVPESGDFFAALVAESPFWSGTRGSRAVAEQHVVFGTLDHAP